MGEFYYAESVFRNAIAWIENLQSAEACIQNEFIEGKINDVHNTAKGGTLNLISIKVQRVMSSLISKLKSMANPF